MQKRKWADTALSILFAAALFFLILTFSISLPIYCRPFYYAHIEPLELTASGFSAAEIRQAYGEVLDYLTLPNRAFSSGVMAASESGIAHFYDCKVLFDLNLTVLLVSAAAAGALLVLKKARKLSLRLGRHTAAYYSALAAILLPLGIGLLASANFEAAFTVFHRVFFPGKENWVFDPAADEIIRVLPMEFFRNCGILIGGSVVLLAVGILTADAIQRKRRKAPAEE